MIKRLLKELSTEFCVQCSEYLYTLPLNLYVCLNPKCPNYGLVQLGSADLNKE